MKWPHVRTPAHTLLLAAQRLIAPPGDNATAHPLLLPLQRALTLLASSAQSARLR